MTHSLIQEQFQQLLSLMSQKLGLEIKANAVTAAGRVSDEWVLDSGATDHVSGLPLAQATFKPPLSPVGLSAGFSSGTFLDKNIQITWSSIQTYFYEDLFPYHGQKELNSLTNSHHTPIFSPCIGPSSLSHKSHDPTNAPQNSETPVDIAPDDQLSSTQSPDEHPAAITKPDDQFPDTQPDEKLPNMQPDN